MLFVSRHFAFAHLIYLLRENEATISIQAYDYECVMWANVLNYMNDTFILFNKIFTSGLFFFYYFHFCHLFFLDTFWLGTIIVLCELALNFRFTLRIILIRNSIDQFQHLNCFNYIGVIIYMNAYNWFYDGHSIDYFFRIHYFYKRRVFAYWNAFWNAWNARKSWNAWKTWKTWNT